MTDFGVVWVFFAKTSTINTASASTRYMILHVVFSSTIRSSAHRAPIAGMGREIGIESVMPRCSFRRFIPASTRAAALNGGVFISPCRITSGFDITSSIVFMARNYIKFVMRIQWPFHVTTVGLEAERHADVAFHRYRIENNEPFMRLRSSASPDFAAIQPPSRPCTTGGSNVAPPRKVKPRVPLRGERTARASNAD